MLLARGSLHESLTDGVTNTGGFKEDAKDSLISRFVAVVFTSFLMLNGGGGGASGPIPVRVFSGVLCGFNWDCNWGIADDS